ncbi:probable ubiquitin-like-specific protease 2B isoform X2 [Spinacia oleracea]|uniref:Probable ubiquitin-like-specific protease 2B isoform X2 n=1 Tax=Spinacia oleracea TaxID=3562 RepID=A0A9R0J227_SPIOL|nr:probable ubiquitin-like-specific protease 2B isoform X2 [Spinacia oleracea]
MKERDLSVYDFNEDDELRDTCHQWSKLSNPKFDNDVAMTKYQFLQHASSGSIAQVKEIRTVKQIHVVAIDDDDDRGFVNDISGQPQNESVKAASEQSEVFGALSDRILQKHCQFSGDSVKPQCPSLDMEIGISCPVELPSGNGHISHSAPESPCSNDSVDAGTSDDCDSIQESAPSTSGSEQEENYDSMDGQSDGGWEMEEMETSILTDYVSYGDKYLPGCRILFTKTSLKLEASALEEESGTSRSEWKLDEIFSIESQWSGIARIAEVKVRLFTRDAAQEEIAHGMEGIEVLEFLAYDPHWIERRERIMTFNTSGKLCEGGPYPLENCESSSDPYLPHFDEPFEEVVYPKGAADAVVISKRDVDLLEPDTFLNDTIIDFYIKYLENEISSSERARFHFFNCFFFRKLADPDKNPSGVFDGKAGYQRVRKWTRKVNLFEKDYIFIPVNYNLHWSLIVICHPGEVANINDENVGESVKVPCILHMDSIRGSHAGLKDLVQSYLSEEWKEKQKETSEDIISKILNLRFLSLELPQQENCSDCGLFLLHYAELFIAEVPKNFSPFQINKFENFLKPDWFMPAEASLKRVHIQRLIYGLLEVAPPENASTCNHNSEPSAFPEIKENDSGLEFISEMSPGKSLNSLHSQSVQGMEMGLLDNISGIADVGMRELFEQRQHYDHGASFRRPGCTMSPIREEVEEVDHLDPPTSAQTELLQRHEMTSEACDIGYTPTDFSNGFEWNSKISDHEENSSPPSNCLSDDSEEMMIIEFGNGLQGAASSGQDQNLDQPKDDNIDSLTESYASASSDMMLTPAEDSQELAQIYGNNDLDVFTPNQEQAKEPPHIDLEELQTPNQTEAKETSLIDLEKSHTPNQTEAKEPSHIDLDTPIQEQAKESSHDFLELHAPNQEQAKESSHGFLELHAPNQEQAKESSHDFLELHTPNQEQAKESSHGFLELHTPNPEEAKEPSNNDLEKSHILNQVQTKKPSSYPEFEIIEDDEDTIAVNEVVEDSGSDPDEVHAAKRIRLTPLGGDGEREIVRSISKELEV